MKSAPLNIYRMLLKKNPQKPGDKCVHVWWGSQQGKVQKLLRFVKPILRIIHKVCLWKIDHIVSHPIQWQCLSSVYRYKSTGLNTFVCCSAGQSPQTIPLCCRVCGGGSVYTHTCPPTVVGWSRYIHEPQTVLRHSVHILKPTRHS